MDRLDEDEPIRGELPSNRGFPGRIGCCESFEREAKKRMPEWRNFLLVEGGPDCN